MDFSKLNGKRICIGVSGGIDSVSLLHYMQNQAKTFGFTLSVVHFEHGIRETDSVLDMQFVQALCQKYNVSCITFQENCIRLAKDTKCSLETAARQFRLDGFAKIIADNQADYIATAHHKNDEAETVLFRLARGSSLTGAQGMAEEDGYMLRPFLSWSKADIIAYARENGLEYREDYTNAETDATRNKLRLNVIPALEESVPGAVDNLARFAQTAAEDDAYLYKQSEKLLTKKQDGYLVAFCKDTPLFFRACVTVLKVLGVERDYTRLHLQLLFGLQDKERGAILCMPKNVRAEKTADGIYFALEEELPTLITLPKYYKDGAFDGGRYVVKLYTAETDIPATDMPILRIDGDMISKNAVFRFRKDGDEMTVFGGKTKSLKKLFNERKISVKERAYLPILADENTIYAVCGVEIADSVKVTGNTRNIQYIVIEKK